MSCVVYAVGVYGVVDPCVTTSYVVYAVYAGVVCCGCVLTHGVRKCVLRMPCTLLLRMLLVTRGLRQRMQCM